MSNIEILKLQKEFETIDLVSIVYSVTNDSTYIESTKFTKSKEENKTDNKCHLCRRKTGLLGFKCSCGGNFCAKHRFLDQHMCINEQEQIKKDLEYLEKQNIRVVADKINKI